jgi:Arc/MetJ family transcription regulator
MHLMKINIVLDEQLLKEAMRLSNTHTKKEVIDLALQNFVAYLKRKDMINLFGKVKWEGDLNEMREA